MSKNVPKIFLSSTRLDLLKERDIATSAINKNYHCITMETWGGSPNPPKEKILEELKNASAVVLILGFKYGSLVDGEEISYTEFEFNYAKENEIDIYAFIKEDKTNANRIDEDNEIIKNKFELFKEKAKDGRTVVHFTDTENLEGEILNTLSKNNDKIQKNKYYTDKFFNDKLKYSIVEFGPRYHSKINIDLDLDFFNVMAKNNIFKESFLNNYVSYYCELKKLKVPQQLKEEFDICLENLKNEKNIIFKDISYDFNKLYNLIKNIEDNLVKISNEFEDNTNEKHEIDILIYQSREHMDRIIGFSYKLLRNPILILTGPAGCGKSHLLADLASKRMDNNEISVLLLGNHFNSDENIGKQIVNELELDMSSTDFLEKLNSKAKYQKSRILIIIDALNESKNKQLWENRLKRFISEIKNYKWLGLIVSIRSTYLDLIPKDIIEKNNIYNHKITSDKTFELIKTHCDNNNVNYPSFPPINPIFSNPLFLKILFENLKKLGKNIIPQKSLDFPTIINEYLKNIEKTLHNKFPIPSGFNVTEMFVEKVIELRIKNPNSKLLYEEAFEIEREISKIINRTNIEILDILIKESLFYEDRLNDKKILRFSFEKIEDHLIARHLLENIEKENLIDEFKKEGRIFKIAEGNEINYYGVLEEFAILLPEKFGIEIFEIDFSEYNIKDIEYKLFEWFINSLYWRNPETVKENIINYIENELEKSGHNSVLFYESLMLLSTNPNYILNANKIHEVLIKDSMPKRDSYWLPWIDKQYRLKYSIYNIVEWAISIKEANKFDEESLKLLTIILSWFLTSNNEELRDKSTYALINLLKNNSKILLELLKSFEKVDDIYIIERLYAVGYGCVLSYKNPEDIKILAEYTYNTVFLNNKFKPNILLKDYAQSIINYSNSQLHFELDISEPKSEDKFPKIPQENEINAIEKECFTKEDITGGSYIFSSMHEHVGNFGRNKFKTKIKYWNYKYTYEELKNLVIKRIFELYDENLHGSYDISIEKNRYALIHPYTCRIGEKYQKIVFYELLELLSTNYKIHNSWIDENEHYLKGAWEIGVRDFDPTFNLKDKIKTIEEPSNSIDFNISKDDWSETHKGIPEIENLINQKKVFSKDDDFLLLFGQVNLNDSNDINFKCRPTKGLILEIWGLVIKKEEKEEIIKKLKYEEISRIVPDIEQNYQVFDKEFSWADSYVDLKKQRDFEKISYLNNSLENHIHVPFYENVWEFDYYLDEKFNKNILKPSKLLFEKMNLKYGDKDNVLYSNDKEVVIDLSNNDIYEYRLIIDKEELLNFLNENNLDIIWLIHGFKITFENSSQNYDKKLYIEGNYYLNENYNLVGNLTYNHYEKHYVANKKSKKIHLTTCRCVKSLNKNNVEQYTTINDAMDDGFEPCSKCLSYFIKK